MKIAICSDSAENQNIKQWLRELDETAMLSIFIYARPEQLLASFKQQQYYDLMFLEFYAARDFLWQLRQMDGRAAIVLLTEATRHNLLPAFEAEVTACLVRPVQKHLVQQVFGRCRNSFLQHNQELRLEVNTEDGVKEEKIFTTRDIFYVESQLRKVYIHTIDARQYQCYGRISNLEQTLRQQDFFRVHKSCLVNLHYICYIGVENIGLMYPGSDSMIHLPLSRRKREQIKEAVQLA